MTAMRKYELRTLRLMLALLALVAIMLASAMVALVWGFTWIPMVLAAVAAMPTSIALVYSAIKMWEK